MKIALLGYGKMGKLIEAIASSRGHTLIARFSKEFGTAEKRQEELALADIAIDFSHASAVKEHVNLCLRLKKPLVIGTTGWEQDLETVKQQVENAGGTCLYAPNFSIGVYLFQQIISYAASLFQQVEEYDVFGIEYHHQQKQDAPSGTAKHLKENVLQHMPRIKDFDFSSIRAGAIPGTHTLQFEGLVDSLTFTHQARNREGFAYGAVKAAEWTLTQRGFLTLDSLFQLQNGEKQCN